ncbi:MAG: MBL fold metallo-hydrolase [Dehalococcoidia bacterium]|nr:MAG: MBL fold metallo-hydrolase [Dehalococcoidia bacterium]
MSAEGWPRWRGEQVAPGVHWLPLADSAWRPRFGAHVTIIGTLQEAVVIDTGDDLDAPSAFIAGYLAGMGNPRLRAILLTHHHRDHSGGAARLRALTGAPILCHPLEVPLLASEGGAERPGLTVDGTLEDGALLRVGGVTIQAIHTPGHSPGHLCFFLPESGLMLTGDLVLGDATTSVSPPHGEMAALLTSLERLLQFPMTRILPGHGPPLADPHAAVAGVLAHRREREAQVLAALQAGFDRPAAIVAAVYQGLAPDLVELAGRQVQSILRKLTQEGRVVAIGEGEEERWQLA